MQHPGPCRRLPRFPRLTLGMEITLLLLVKIILITVLSKTFFAHPEAKQMTMPLKSVEERILPMTETSGKPDSATPETKQ